MKTFKQYHEDIASGTSTANVVGTGSDTDTIVVRRKKKNKSVDLVPLIKRLQK